MKNLFLIIVLLFTISQTDFAQRQGISIGGNVVFPVGDWAEIASIGYGGSATYEHPLGKNISGVIYSGYTYFVGDDLGFNWSMIPLVAGAKFYFTPEQDWYMAGLLGVNFITADKPTSGLLAGLDPESTSSTEFAGNVNLGYEIKTSDKGAVDISAGFIYIDQLSYFGMRLAYIFKL